MLPVVAFLCVFSLCAFFIVCVFQTSEALGGRLILTIRSAEVSLKGPYQTLKTMNDAS